ncbi:MAG TPA: S-layer homology domain-containing protein [Candidatus Scatomorpha intestinavium]|uniref:S-layer homology domain-containing protein n=1 Tax=Candidatus Scatomorpha intestinavium TaxID=2840922 RepID=A0A9D0ZF34_9FIRM|nr:S-layer homology domain-containing protein [Candidatus Scatomorpha intestinavium]
MKKVLSLILALALLGTCALAYGEGTGQAVYTNEWALADGLTYENAVSYNSADERVETFTITLEPGSSVYPIVMACDTIYGGMTITSMIDYAELMGYDVVGAVNADFGYWDTRIPCGMVVEDGIYKSSPEGNHAIGFLDDGTAVVSSRPEVYITIENETTGQVFETTHLNKTRSDDGLYLYSEYFSTVSTRTDESGWYIRLRVRDHGELSLDGEIECEVEEIVTGEDAVEIGPGYLILTASDEAGLENVLSGFMEGDEVTIFTRCTDSALAEADWVSGCGNILALNGELYEPQWWDTSIDDANPRTVIGLMGDGTVVYQVMDGRSDLSAGSTLDELVADLLSMGCETVVNMDGGGSSALALRMPGQDGYTIVNNPSDGTLRSVCSYILFVTEEDASGEAENLFLTDDGAYILAGSTLPLELAATDNTMRTVRLSGQVRATASRGSISSGVYTAPSTAGADVITLSAGSAYGTSTLHVVEKADSLSVEDAESGEAVTQLLMEQGESIQLDACLQYNMRDVISGNEDATFSLSGDVGAISADGLYVASGTPGAEGSITVTAAGLTATIPVKIAVEFTDMKGHWAEDAVKELYEAGIVTGMTQTTFGPDSTMRRCDFVLMLYRAAGEPEVSADSGFTDVAADAYYARAVAWAKAEGITTGTSDTTFSPDATLTRQEGFTFLYRAFDSLGVVYDVGDTALIDSYADGSSVADWAREAAATLISMGIVQGDGSGLNPGGGLTRAQMAKMLASAI